MLPNYRIWFEYEILGWPPKLLAEKYNTTINNVCRMVRNKRNLYKEIEIPTKWLKEKRWKK